MSFNQNRVVSVFSTSTLNSSFFVSAMLMFFASEVNATGPPQDSKLDQAWRDGRTGMRGRAWPTALLHNPERRAGSSAALRTAARTPICRLSLQMQFAASAISLRTARSHPWISIATSSSKRSSKPTIPVLATCGSHGPSSQPISSCPCRR